MVAHIPLAIRQARQLTETSSRISEVSVSLNDENSNCTFRFHNGKSTVSQSTSVYICHYIKFSQLSMLSEGRKTRICHKQSMKPNKIHMSYRYYIVGFLFFFLFYSTEEKLCSGHSFKFLLSALKTSGSARETIAFLVNHQQHSPLILGYPSSSKKHPGCWCFSSNLFYSTTSLLLATLSADTVLILPQLDAMIWALEAFYATLSCETLNRQLTSCLINWI